MDGVAGLVAAEVERAAHPDEPEQDLLFEHCRINGLKAYRIRPYNIKTLNGGWGDDTLEIACGCCLKERLDLNIGSVVEDVLAGSVLGSGDEMTQQPNQLKRSSRYT